MGKDWSKWKTTVEQESQISMFIEDLRKSQLDFTAYKIHLTKNNLWSKYSKIMKQCVFKYNSGGAVFVKPGLKLFAFRAIMKEIKHDVNKEYHVMN